MEMSNDSRVGPANRSACTPSDIGRQLKAASISAIMTGKMTSSIKPGFGLGRFYDSKERTAPSVGGLRSARSLGSPRSFGGLPAARPSSLPRLISSIRSLPWWVVALLAAILLPIVSGPSLAAAQGGADMLKYNAGVRSEWPLASSYGIANAGGRGLQAGVPPPPPHPPAPGVPTAHALSPSPEAENKYAPSEKLVFWDEFDSLDLTSRWKPEISAGGFGNWEFQVYLNNRSSLFVKDSKLFIKPSRLEIPDSLIKEGYTMDLWGTDPPSQCTGNAFWGCLRTSGTGGSIINPIVSARVRSAEFFSFKYGRVEVRARMPKGDWLWPAIWLLPRHQAYGPWPASGEIDIVESRGNAPSYPPGGHDKFGSTLHVGPYSSGNMFTSMTSSWGTTPGQPTLADEFHTYGLKWTSLGLFTYIDDPNNAVLRVTWDVPGGQFDRGTKRGHFPSTVHNPWAGSSNLPAAPFDQEFYLIMNVAVGGTMGYFPEGQGGKPWGNSASAPMNSFWDARDRWLPTWNGDASAMVVDWVRVYQDATGTEGATASGEWLRHSGALASSISSPSTVVRQQETGTARAMEDVGAPKEVRKQRVLLNVNVGE